MTVNMDVLTLKRCFAVQSSCLPFKCLSASYILCLNCRNVLRTSTLGISELHVLLKVIPTKTDSAKCFSVGECI